MTAANTPVPLIGPAASGDHAAGKTPSAQDDAGSGCRRDAEKDDPGNEPSGCPAVGKRGFQFLPLRRLVGQPLYIPSRRSRLESIRAWFEELGEEPTIAGDLSHYIDAVALSEQNAGICIYPMTTYNVSDLIVTKIITESARQVEYALVWKRNDRQTELQQEFINYVQDCMEEERRGTQPYIMPEREYFPPEDTKYL